MDNNQLDPVITPRASGAEYTRRQERPNGMKLCLVGVLALCLCSAGK